MPSSTILAISLFFHLLATIIWVGGLVITVLLVWPEMRNTLQDSPALYGLLTRLRKRFTPLSNLSLAVLIVTGLTQMALDENYNGVLDFSNTWSQVILFKHIVIVGMVISGVVLQASVIPALERTSLLIEKGKANDADWQKLRQREIRLTWFNAVLGVAVLGFSAWAGAL